MRKSLFKDLERGDIIKHKTQEQTYVVSGNYGSHVIAITSVHMSNPDEWDLVLKANHTRPIKDVGG